MDKLKPCPFCGSEKLILDKMAHKMGAYSFPGIFCEMCLMTVGGPPDIETLIEIYNDRPSESDKVKQLKRSNKLLRKKIEKLKLQIENKNGDADSVDGMCYDYRENIGCPSRKDDGSC